MTTTSTSAPREEMLSTIQQLLGRYDVPNQIFPVGVRAKETVTDYPDELLEALISILEDAGKQDFLEIVKSINTPRCYDLMLPTAKLCQQLSGVTFLPGEGLGFSQTMHYVETLKAYENDSRVPPVPEAGYPLHPMHLAVIMVTEATYLLMMTTEFNGIDEAIIDWVSDSSGVDTGVTDWMAGTNYHLIGKELLDYLSANPHNGSKVALVGYLLSTMRLEELLPYVAIMEKNPDSEQQIIAMLSSGTNRVAQVEAVLNGEIMNPISEGTL